MDNKSYFLCVLTYAIIYVLIHQIIFGFTFLNILYFIKYSRTNIFDITTMTQLILSSVHIDGLAVKPWGVSSLNTNYSLTISDLTSRSFQLFVE